MTQPSHPSALHRTRDFSLSAHPGTKTGIERGGMLSGKKWDVRHGGPGRVRNGGLLVLRKAGSKDAWTRPGHTRGVLCAVPALCPSDFKTVRCLIPLGLLKQAAWASRGSGI